MAGTRNQQPTIVTRIPVILSGGAASRLWPVSCESHPKPFIRLAYGQSLLQEALLRAAALPGVRQVCTVTNREFLFKTEDTPIDYTVIEKSRQVTMVPHPIAPIEIGSGTAPTGLQTTNAQPAQMRGATLSRGINNLSALAERNDPVVGAVHIYRLPIIDLPNALPVKVGYTLPGMVALYSQLTSGTHPEHRPHRLPQLEQLHDPTGSSPFQEKVHLSKTRQHRIAANAPLPRRGFNRHIGNRPPHNRRPRFLRTQQRVHLPLAASTHARATPGQCLSHSSK